MNVCYLSTLHDFYKKINELDKNFYVYKSCILFYTTVQLQNKYILNIFQLLLRY